MTTDSAHPTHAARIRVIGVGNPDRGDDAAGPLLLHALARRVGPDVALVPCGGDTLGLIEAWRGATLAVVVDAMRSGAPPGTVVRFDVSRAPLPARLASAASSHGLGVAEAVELARTLGRLPERLLVWAIEAGPDAIGTAPSPELLAAIEHCADEIAAECAAAASTARGD